MTVLRVKIRTIILVVTFVLSGLLFFRIPKTTTEHGVAGQLYTVESIDTMKYSRDVSREKLADPLFDTVIDRQVFNIAKTGATHVAIGTPYDSEFIPILNRWVQAARKYNINVWFRGNFSGWEGWFGYSRIDREMHKSQTKAFIETHADLFADGDIFSTCPECENGGPGDPRHIGNILGHRKFLIEEYTITKDAFKKINKKVASNYNSMNADVARLIMDKETTAALDGIVVIDHYVRTPQQLVSDIESIAKQSGGKVVLGEFGAPIPDIHGKLSEEEQADWLSQAFEALLTTDKLLGVNYWTNVGGSTELWDGGGKPRKAVAVVASFYSSTVVEGVVTDTFRRPIVGAIVSTQSHKTVTKEEGNFALPIKEGEYRIIVNKEGFKEKKTILSGKESNLAVHLEKKNPSLFDAIAAFFAQFAFVFEIDK